jgi:monoamine oxidase
LSISRRNFLVKGAAATAGAGLCGPALATSLVSLVRGPAKKVLILGAGMAGLVAGYELSRLGHDITILEARRRPGGRVHTLHEPFSDGLYAEAGAARIPDDHDLTLKYVKVFDLPLDPFYPSKLKALRYDLGDRQEVPIDGFTEAMNRYFGHELGGKPDRWRKIRGGSDLLPRAFARELANKIFYSAPAVKIEQDSRNVRVVFLRGASSQVLSADRLLVTIPFSVLRTIESPGISATKQDLIKRTNYDAVSRVYLQTRNRFFEDKGFNGFAFAPGPIEVWQPTWNQPGPRAILMTYARPGEAERITGLKEADRIGTTLTQIESMFPGTQDNFEAGFTKCWMEDEWSRGAWAFVARDTSEAQSPDGRIHFAGEHLSRWPSWMQGALSSGLRAVKEIDEAA